MKLHLGCGPIRLVDWINIDIESPVADMHLDLRNTLPFQDDSVEFIFAEHFIEHIQRDEALRLLFELKRVLIPGGTIRLSTPSLRFLAITYLSGNIYEWGDLWRPKNPAQLMNEGMRLWGHQYIYDEPDLESLLFEAGFTHRTYQAWGKSRYEALSDLETRPFHQDLIIEASKPLVNGDIDAYEYIFLTEIDWIKKIEHQNKDYIFQLENKISELEKLNLKNPTLLKPQSLFGKLMNNIFKSSPF